MHYIVSIKSGTNWGNSSQQHKHEQDFRTAVGVLKQSRHTLNVQPVLGICYGKTRTSHVRGYTSHVRGYMKVVGQNFWYLMSENKELYTDIVKPLGYRAKEHNNTFDARKGGILNKFTNEFMAEFCGNDGTIDWQKLIVFNSGDSAHWRSAWGAPGQGRHCVAIHKMRISKNLQLPVDRQSSK